MTTSPGGRAPRAGAPRERFYAALRGVCQLLPTARPVNSPTAGLVADGLADQGVVVRVLRALRPAGRVGEVRPAEEDVVDLVAPGLRLLRVDVEEAAALAGV